jgi:hypothetical protein
MFRFSVVRMAAIMLYFMACTVCGCPAHKPPPVEQNLPVSTAEATDINFIGGGTQAPVIEDDNEYRSPTLSTAPPPTSLTWISSIDQATRLAERDNNTKVILWFRNDACSDCLSFERDVLTNPDVIGASAHWLFVKVDTERNEDRAEYYLHGADPPALVFLDKLGHEYRRQYGAVTPEEFVTMLRTWR